MGNRLLVGSNKNAFEIIMQNKFLKCDDLLLGRCYDSSIRKKTECLLDRIYEVESTLGTKITN